MLMVSANIYDQLNNTMTTNSDNEKENSDSSTQNDQISELTQEVQNMGKALAAISERTNANTEQSIIPKQIFNPRPRVSNTGQYQMTHQNIRRYQPNVR